MAAITAAKRKIKKITEDATTLEVSAPKRPYNGILTVPLVALYLSKQKSPAEIARIMGVSDTSVYTFISRHKEDLGILSESDELLRYKLNHKNHKLIDSIDKVNLDKVNPKDRYIMLGIGIDKSKQLSQADGSQYPTSITLNVVAAPGSTIEVQVPPAKGMISNETPQDVVIEGEIMSDNPEGQSTIE